MSRQGHDRSVATGPPDKSTCIGLSLALCLLAGNSIVSNKVPTPYPMFYRPDRIGTCFRRDLIYILFDISLVEELREGWTNRCPMIVSLSEVATRFTPLVVA